MEAELYTPNAGGRAGFAAPAPGTPVSALVGILYERDDIQTLNSYARLIWVRHLHGISDNCQSPKIRVEMRLCGHFCRTQPGHTRLHVRAFIRLIVRKVALIHGTPCLTGYAGWTTKENRRTFVDRITRFNAKKTFRPAWPTPPDESCRAFYCSSAGHFAPLQRENSASHASAFSVASMSSKTDDSPFSPQ